jgi:hypothetical protein
VALATTAALRIPRLRPHGAVADGAISVPFSGEGGYGGTVPLRDFQAASLGTGLYDCG